MCDATGAAGEDVVEPGGDVGVLVEAEHRVGLGQRLGELLAVPLGQAADSDDGLGRCAVWHVVLSSAAASRVSTESFLAASMKPQVLTSTASASAASSTSCQPSPASRPASSSLSVSLRAQPRVTSGEAAGGETGVDTRSGYRLAARANPYGTGIHDRDSTAPDQPWAVLRRASG